MRMPATSTANGVAMTTGPANVCKIPGTPPLPIPMMSIGQARNCKGSKKVKVCDKGIVVKSDKIASSNGDEPGTLKGLMAPKQGSVIEWSQGSGCVKVKGKPAVCLTMTVKCNGGNAPPGIHTVPSQSTVLIKK
jgi:hypothetical protein